ncbi:hypothetical protein [Amaricoccus solimangrovi]|uniref:hypothetical protein n=1 Tax=Amaricoccus solimangrovi TaxID=2589815 RepID=UPI0015E2E70B|nr:hypothetical protein [Amaricoccus solimangrovi]
MIVDAYQQVLRNSELVSRKPAQQSKVRTDNTASAWFAHYASLLAGIWGKDTAPLV